MGETNPEVFLMENGMGLGVRVNVSGPIKDRTGTRTQMRQLREKLVAKRFSMDFFDDYWDNPGNFGIVTTESELIDYFILFAREQLERPTISIRITPKFSREALFRKISEGLGQPISSFRHLTKAIPAQNYALVIICDEGAHKNNDAYTFLTWVRALAPIHKNIVALMPAPKDINANFGRGGHGGLKARLQTFFPH